MTAEGQHHTRSQGEPSSDDTGTSAGNDPLARRMGELARQFQREKGTPATLAYLVSAAVELIPGAQEASLSMVFRRKIVQAQYPTGTLPAVVDALQTETGQGPCLDAVYQQQTTRVNDLGAAADRWPLFAPRAVDAGARSMLAIQLYVEGDNLGALNLFSTEVGAFNDESEHIGLLFATHAAIAFAASRQHDQLQQAVDSRDVIGQAKGMLMERYGLSVDRAFLLLARISQETNTRLYDVAAELIRTGITPGHGGRGGQPI